MWQAEHHVTAEDEWPEFQALLQALPTPPEPFQYDDSLEAWKKAVKKLRSTSARGFDAVSAQELKMIPETLLQELIQVCNNYANGFPTWFMRTRVCPLNKVEGTPTAQQSRPICIMSQIYRLYAGVFCTQVLRFWSTFFPLSITGMLPTRGSHDAAYAMQMMIEIAKSRGQDASGLTLDIKKCFNCIRHEAGRRLLLAMGLPSQRANQFYHSIRRMQRYWEINGQSFGPVHAQCGFPEGDAHSVLVMLLIALLWSSNVQAMTSASLAATAYADNWSWHTGHVHDHGPAAKTTVAVTQCCGLSIDWQKTWRWATDTVTAEKAWESLGEELTHNGVDRCHNAKDLGFQIHYSGVRELGSRKTRLEQGMKRLSRLALLPHDLSTKEHILRSSIYPAMFYGTEIFPIAIDTLSKVRAAAAEALIGQSHSMSPALVLFLTKGGILDPEFIIMAQALRSAIQWLSKQPGEQQKAVFAVAAKFLGGTMRTQGPASTLKHYFQKMSWEIDKQGYVLTDGFSKWHLVKDGYPKLHHMLTLAWQQKLVMMMTSRHSLYSMPDVSRCDTVSILQTFSDSERRQLLREIAGAYQLEGQKAHWTSDSDGSCPFCGEMDSKQHRFQECAAFAHVRESFTMVLRQVEEEGLTIAQMPVIHSHADMQMHQLLHNQQPHAILMERFYEFARERQMHNQTFHIYVDGSCCYPRFPTSRFAAYSGVIDTAHNDVHRRELAQCFLRDGTIPNTLVTCFASRVQGAQNIPRAELKAIQVASALPFGLIHSDSAYALGRATLAVHDTSKFYAMTNTDLLWEIHDMQPDPARFVKIKAHKNLFDIGDLLDLYHALGNHVADQSAKMACKSLNPEWHHELQVFHEQTDLARNLLAECYKLHLELFKARAAMAQQMTRQDSDAVPSHAKTSPTAVVNAIKSWEPRDKQVLHFPQDDLSWFSKFSWGEVWARDLYSWMQGFQWPTEPQGPLEKELGVSWIELALSFSMTTKKCLPILRKNHLGKTRLLMVEDETDVTAHSVHLTDIATTMQKMWAQSMLLLPSEACPCLGKDLQISLYVQGFGESVSGMTPRPKFPKQHRVSDYVQQYLLGKSSYDHPFVNGWLDRRSGELQDKDWLAICDAFKYGRRSSKVRHRVHQPS